MAWTDGLSRVKFADGRELIGASFRGVPFYVDESDRGGGRRLGTHEFIDSDFPAFDDNGRAIKTYRVKGYVLGESYLRDRDTLLRALEDVAGPGDLVHPFYGRKRAVVGQISVRESIRDGGMAVFSIEFSEAPDTTAPTEVADLDAGVTSWATIALISSQTEFEATYDVDGQPSFATVSLRAELTSLSTSLLTALAPIVETTQELALLHVEIDIITAQVATLIRTPTDVINALIDAVLQLEDSIAASPLAIAEALITAYEELPIDLVLGDTATRVQERINQAALADALRRALVIYAAKFLIDVTFETLGDAKASVATVTSAIDSLAATAGTSYPSLLSLRSALIQAVPGDAALAQVRTVTNRVALPSILLSYNLYGTVAEEADIIARNSVQHPAFIAGSIEVLSFG